jgi:hypothetical protein
MRLTTRESAKIAVPPTRNTPAIIVMIDHWKAADPAPSLQLGQANAVSASQSSGRAATKGTSLRMGPRAYRAL